MNRLKSVTFRQQRGLTLSELLITLFVFSLLVSTLGAVANTLVSKNRMINAANLMINDYNLMRSTALNMGREITICAANSSNDACSGGDTWSNGWIIFIDTNLNRSLDSNEEILRQQGPIGGSVQIISNISLDNDDWNSYKGDGSVTFNGSYWVCDPNQPANNRSVNIQRVRRPFVTRNTATCPP